MSREGDLMRKALRKHLLPALARLGFTGNAAHFQRARADTLDLLSIQYWKHGGEFVLEFARRGRGDFVASWGEVVPEAKLDVAYADVLGRARLEGRRNSRSGFHGFAFDQLGEDAAAYEAIALRVVELLPQVDAWLERSEAGDHVRPLGVA